MREKKINGLGLITVISIVCDRAFRFEWNVGTDGRATERTESVLRFAHVVGAVHLLGFAKIMIGCQLSVGWLTIDALGCVPVLNVVLNPVCELCAAVYLTLT